VAEFPHRWTRIQTRQQPGYSLLLYPSHLAALPQHVNTALTQTEHHLIALHMVYLVISGRNRVTRVIDLMLRSACGGDGCSMMVIICIYVAAGLTQQHHMSPHVGLL